jgi:hypothetical protein
MPEVPWLRILDTVIGVADIALTAVGGRGGGAPAAERQEMDVSPRGGGAPETHIAGVVVAALKEAFDRDARRMQFERELAEEARLRAERALTLELQRQAGDREIGRLRLLAGVAGTAWIAALLLSARLVGGGVGARVTLGFGWLFLLLAIAASFVAQSRVAAAIDALSSGNDTRGAFRPGASGAVTLGLMICGLILVGVAALMA